MTVYVQKILVLVNYIITSQYLTVSDSESMGIVQFAVHVFLRAGGELDWLVYYKTLGFNSQEFKIIQCVHADLMSRRGNSCHRKLPLFTFKNHSYHQ